MNEMTLSLVAILNEQISCAQKMLATLARENEALVDGDADLLNTAGAEKARLVEALDSLEHERRALSDAIGLTGSFHGTWRTSDHPRYGLAHSSVAGVGAA